MKRLIACAAVAVGIATLPAAPVFASPEDDLQAFRAYFKKKFPDVPFEEFKNGVYAIDKASREQWEEIEEFPPYEINIEKGEAIFNKPFKNGKTFADCFGKDPSTVRARYPKYDEGSGLVLTLESQINACLKANGEKPFKYKKGKIADLSAFFAYKARGQKVDVKVEGPKAEAAYNKGKQFFYAKRGQLNMSCADCHVYYAGSRIRADILSPALGHVTHFPVYRSKWGGLGTLHRRYGGCNKQVRAKPFKAQSNEYRTLELFHSYMSNGLEWNGPGARK